MELAYAKWEVYWNNMGEILGWGKPKKKKGKILPLVKKNWNWEFQYNNDIFFILFASLCPLALSPQCRICFFFPLDKKMPNDISQILV